MRLNLEPNENGASWAALGEAGAHLPMGRDVCCVLTFTVMGNQPPLAAGGALLQADVMGR